MTKDEAITHLKDKCPLMPFTCKVCQETKPRNKFINHFPNECITGMQKVYKTNTKELANLDKEY